RGTREAAPEPRTGGGTPVDTGVRPAEVLGTHHACGTGSRRVRGRPPGGGRGLLRRSAGADHRAAGGNSLAVRTRALRAAVDGRRARTARSHVARIADRPVPRTPRSGPAPHHAACTRYPRS